MSRESSLTQSGHSVRQALTAYKAMEIEGTKFGSITIDRKSYELLLGPSDQPTQQAPTRTLSRPGFMSLPIASRSKL